ncbi:hypothetical protein ACFY93_14790 [Streptomyces sp. NPDC008313]|uniref:hypothetical protein n=1 Tax=Streptomyces sp. NPDC008313 TaxID=3364826 RepID=UPI0036EFA19E
MDSRDEGAPAGTSHQVLHPDQVKHLELIQGVVARLANNSFLVKGWSLTLTGGLLAFAAGSAGWPVAATALVALVAFWFLDGYFLQQERLFRRLYDAVRQPGGTVEPFTMDPHPYAAEVDWARAAFSPTLSLFYGGLGAAHVAFLVALLTA